MYIPTLIVYTYMHHGQYARPSPTWERERERESNATSGPPGYY